MHILYIGEEAPKIHNITTIMNLVFKSLPDEIAIKSKEQYNGYKPFMVKLLSYYISERYIEYKDKISQKLNKDVCEELLEKTKEVFKWLQSLKNF